MKKEVSRIGFKAFLATLFLGAFNDNVFKLLVSLLAVDRFMRAEGGTFYVSAASAVFIIPFIIFSMPAGYLADLYSKRTVIIWTKLLEVVVMAAGMAAFYWGNIWVMLGVLFLMGTQSAVFGPAKYGIIPEMLRDEEISMGNGMVQLWTMLAIIIGTAAAGQMLELADGRYYYVSLWLIAVSAAGLLTAFRVTKVPPSGAKRAFSVNIARDLREAFTIIRTKRALFLCVLGSVYFWFLGAMFQMNVVVYTRKLMGLEYSQSGMMLALIALGVGAGSVLAGRWSGKRVEFGLVPFGSLGLTFFSFVLGFSWHSPFVTGCTLFLLGMSCGFFLIPLNAYVQKESPPKEKGRVLAALNTLSFVGILCASILFWLFRDIAGLSSAGIFVLMAFVTAGVSIYIFCLVPDFFLRFLGILVTRAIYRVSHQGAANVPETGPALLVSNHASYIDPLFILASLDRPVRFLMFREFYEKPLFKPLCKLMKVIPISYKDSPKDLMAAIQEARGALLNGELVCIFAEGQVTRTGRLYTFKEGFRKILKGTDAPVIPVYLDRLWGSIFSFEGGRVLYKIPKKIPYPATAVFGEPLSKDADAFTVRQAVAELSVEAFALRKPDWDTLPEAFLAQARRTPFRTVIADSSGKSLTCMQTAAAAVCLVRRVKRECSEEDMVGILMPPCAGGALAVLGVSCASKVPVYLNYTASQEIIDNITERCSLKHVITSRKFLEKTGIACEGKEVFIEDLAQEISLLDRVKAALSVYFPLWSLARLFALGKKRHSLEDPAGIIFSSGSTGKPKGVVLTHANVIANIESLDQVVNPDRNTVVMGLLPFFHSFGHTATMWYPLVKGIKAVYHVNPIDSKTIGKMVRQHKATLMMATPTFLSAYTRRCDPEDFATLTLVVTGAEKLRTSIAQAFIEKFSITPYEGYGCTECSPAVSLNLPGYKDDEMEQVENKPGKIGKALPGIAVKIVDPDTFETLGAGQPGLMLVKGNNVMAGYFNDPDKTAEVMRDGWYITGDIAAIDEDGFIEITDRLSRFSKIGGEMVPHIKVEDAIHQVLEAAEQVCVVTGVPDEKKGERLVVLHTIDIDIEAVRKALQASGLPNLWIPQKDVFFKIDEIVTLGTGKVDLRRIKEIALGLAEGTEK